jgi:hypothetical protein
MTINAFKAGNAITAAELNNHISMQTFAVINEGTQDDGMTDAGVTAHDVASYNHMIQFATGGGITTVTRLELDIASDGSGADLTIGIRSNTFNPDGSADGVLLYTFTVPKEFIPASQAFWSIPINITGLTAATTYWIHVYKAGDGTNHNHLYSKGSEKDASHKCYRRSGSTGAWTDLSDSIRFKVFYGTAGVLYHVINGTNCKVTVEYDTGVQSKIYKYLPPSGATAGGIRNILTLAYDSGKLTGGTVT